MFIYLFGKNDYDNGYIEDAVEIATTDIQKILDHLSLSRMSYLTMTDYSIIVKIDGEEYSEELCVSKSMYEKLIKYPPTRLLQYKSEYEEMKNKIIKWCEDISVQIEEKRKQKEEAERLKKEHAERAMFEKLKAKYGNE